MTDPRLGVAGLILAAVVAFALAAVALPAALDAMVASVPLGF